MIAGVLTGGAVLVALILCRITYLWGVAAGLREARGIADESWARRMDWRPEDVAAITRKQCSQCWRDASACTCATKERG